MKNPSQQQNDIDRFKRLYLMDVFRDPLRYKRRSHNNCGRQAPRIVPSFNVDKTYDETEAARIRAMICMLGELNSPSFSSITSDDLAII